MVPKIIVGILLLAAALAGCVVYLRHAFQTHLDQIEAVIRGGEAAPMPPADLPPEVLALAHKMGARSDAPPACAVFTQSGVMWFSPGAKPTKFTARQVAGTRTPGFSWRAALGPAGAILVADYFAQGVGGLEVKLLGAVTLARMVDTAAVNQGEMIRYLAELPWNPDAILANRFLAWTVIDARTLKVAAGAGDMRGEVTFTLGADGLIESISASRLYTGKGQTIPLPWHGRFWDYQNIGGRFLPLQGEVAWVMEGKEFVYWRGRLLRWERGD